MSLAIDILFQTARRILVALLVIAGPISAVMQYAQTTSAAGTVAARHTVIAATGTAAPSGGNFSGFSNISLNAQHRVAFDALLDPSGTTGIFVGDGKRTSTVALEADPDPTAQSFGFLFNPFITLRGDVVFDSDSNTLLSDGKSITPLALEGSPAPGGGTLSPSVHAANDQGALATFAFVNDSTATQGIFLTDGGRTVAIARDDVAPPTGGQFLNLFDPAVNDRGQVAFESEMTGGSADFGVFRGEGSGLTPIFLAGQAAPGGSIFADFGNPVLNSHGQVADVCVLDDFASAGIFVSDGTNTVAIAVEGQAAPKGGNYRNPNAFIGKVRLNDRGDVAFTSRLSGGTSTNGVFRGDGTQTTTIALAGTIAPGTTGTFQSFDDIKLGDDGRVAIIGRLALGVGGVNTTNNTGIWVGTSDADLQLVVRTSDVIGGNILTRLPGAAGGLNQFSMNQNSIAWIGTFGSSREIVVSRLLDADDND